MLRTMMTMTMLTLTVVMIVVSQVICPGSNGTSHPELEAGSNLKSEGFSSVRPEERIKGRDGVSAMVQKT